MKYIKIINNNENFYFLTIENINLIIDYYNNNDKIIFKKTISLMLFQEILLLFLHGDNKQKIDKIN